MKFVVDTCPLRNEEVIKKTFFHKNSKFQVHSKFNGYSDNFYSSVVNRVTYDVVDDQKHIFEV
jgi:hypothetical protein